MDIQSIGTYAAAAAAVTYGVVTADYSGGIAAGAGVCVALARVRHAVSPRWWTPGAVAGSLAVSALVMLAAVVAAGPRPLALVPAALAATTWWLARRAEADVDHMFPRPDPRGRIYHVGTLLDDLERAGLQRDAASWILLRRGVLRAMAVRDEVKALARDAKTSEALLSGIGPVNVPENADADWFRAAVEMYHTATVRIVGSVRRELEWIVSGSEWDAPRSEGRIREWLVQMSRITLHRAATLCEKDDVCGTWRIDDAGGPHWYRRSPGYQVALWAGRLKPGFYAAKMQGDSLLVERRESADGPIVETMLLDSHGDAE